MHPKGCLPIFSKAGGRPAGLPHAQASLPGVESASGFANFTGGGSSGSTHRGSSLVGASPVHAKVQSPVLNAPQAVVGGSPAATTFAPVPWRTNAATSLAAAAAPWKSGSSGASGAVAASAAAAPWNQARASTAAPLASDAVPSQSQDDIVAALRSQFMSRPELMELLDKSASQATSETAAGTAPAEGASSAAGGAVTGGDMEADAAGSAGQKTLTSGSSKSPPPPTDVDAASGPKAAANNSDAGAEVSAPSVVAAGPAADPGPAEGGGNACAAAVAGGGLDSDVGGHRAAAPPTVNGAAASPSAVGRSQATSVPQAYTYEIHPGDDLDAWFRNVRRRLEVELEDACTVQVIQSATRLPGQLPARVNGHLARAIVESGENSVDQTAYKYVIGPCDNVDAHFAVLRRRMEVELGDGCTLEIIGSAI